ncbi:hypothetical protein GCM10020000_58840 [Streptomyces olivoverticillatus]
MTAAAPATLAVLPAPPGTVEAAATSTCSPTRAKPSTSWSRTPRPGAGSVGGRGVAVLAQQAHGGAQLLQGRAAGLADMGEGLFGLVGAAVHDV